MGTRHLRRLALVVAAAGPLVAGVPPSGSADAEPRPPRLPTAEILRDRSARDGTEAALEEAFEKICLEDGKHWDDVKRECVYRMRSKE